MLDLKRASAGSGKTYALTQYYIKCLIGVRDENDGHYRLRRPDELGEGLKSILAITFTNKATNEMQMRIVDKLDALASWKPGDKKPDYLEDFSKLFDVPETEIASIAGSALRILLNNYSDFNVSTIDSFFQTVMRTLAYEVGIPQTYNVEMDSEYVSRTGLDMLLQDVDNPRPDADACEAAMWINIIMNNDTSTKWNFYSKPESQDSFTQTSFGKMIDAFRRIDNEDYREHRDEIEEWLGSHDLIAIYQTMEQRYIEPVHQAFEATRKVAKQLKELTERIGCGPEGRAYENKPAKQARDILACSWNKPLKKPMEPLAQPGKTVLKRLEGIPEWSLIAETYNDMYKAWCEWDRLLNDPDTRLWSALRLNFPFLGLLKGVSKRRQMYLNENSAVELGETAYILSKFIVDGVPPFVYERMGTRLQHFLIDEFQDTSRLQWTNIKPLLEESLAQGSNDNLIIGDPKQSIYRFRSAEPELINTQVEKDFPDYVRTESDVDSEGNKKNPNTNYRSDRRVVEWNNQLFDFISKDIGRFAGERPVGEDAATRFGQLYSNVIQNIKHEDTEGYVRAYLYDNSRKRKSFGTDAVDAENDDDAPFDVYDETLKIILDALKRGYRQKDIAVLSRDNKTGIELIERLRAYNNKVDEGQPGCKIDFVSEQSLLVGNAMAVKQVETVLRAIGNGSRPRLNSEDERAKYGAGSIAELECHILLYGSMHPELTRTECLERFLNGDFDTNPIRDMLESMQTTALPDLVETIVERFITEDLRTRDAVFLSAFADCVLEYCQSHSSDILSFLAWWDRRRATQAISSPEDMDAVNIMTIHKSKGLEFPVVIIPSALKSKYRFGDYTMGADWQWVARDKLFADGVDRDEFPPYMPVNINDMLAGTSLGSQLQRQYNLETMDNLNATYVAFTRARSELYIFSTPYAAGEHDKSLSRLIKDFAQSDALSDEQKTHLKVTTSDNGTLMEYGTLPERAVIKEEKKGVVEPLTTYYSNHIADSIKCRMDSLPDVQEDADGETEDRNPRSLGNLCHAIMENVDTFDDIPYQMERARMLGLIGEREEKLFEENNLVGHLTIDHPQVRRWFGGGASRILTERPLLRSGIGLRRPDRMMEWPDGSVDIIDYKFGLDADSSRGKYHGQVRNYMKWVAQTGKYTAVRGWLWYVLLDKVEKV